MPARTGSSTTAGAAIAPRVASCGSTRSTSPPAGPWSTAATDPRAVQRADRRSHRTMHVLAPAPSAERMTESTETRIEPHAWFVLVAAMLGQLPISMLFFGLPAMAPILRDDLGLSITQFGIAVGALN